MEGKSDKGQTHLYSAEPAGVVRASVSRQSRPSKISLPSDNMPVSYAYRSAGTSIGARQSRRHTLPRRLDISGKF
jgi:hypothetical protein